MIRNIYIVTNRDNIQDIQQNVRQKHNRGIIVDIIANNNPFKKYMYMSILKCFTTI